MVSETFINLLGRGLWLHHRMSQPGRQPINCQMSVYFWWSYSDNVSSYPHRGLSQPAQAMSLGGTVLLRRQRHTLHMAEKAKRMLKSVSYYAGRRQCKRILPKCNAQAPDGFHLIACGLARTNPVAVYNSPTLLVERFLELRAQLRSRFSNTGGADGLAIQVRERLANDNSDNG